MAHFWVSSKVGPFFLVLEYVGFYVRAPTMAPPSMPYTPEALRDAIVAVHGNECNKRDVTTKFNVPMRTVSNAIIELEAVNSIRCEGGQLPLLQGLFRKQVYRWASKFAGARVTYGCTTYEKQQALVLDCLVSTLPLLALYKAHFFT